MYEKHYINDQCCICPAYHQVHVHVCMYSYVPLSLPTFIKLFEKGIFSLAQFLHKTLFLHLHSLHEYLYMLGEAYRFGIYKRVRITLFYGTYKYTCTCCTYAYTMIYDHEGGAHGGGTSYLVLVLIITHVHVHVHATLLVCYQALIQDCKFQVY